MNQLGDCSDDTACERDWPATDNRGRHSTLSTHDVYLLQTIRPLEYAFLYVLYLTHLVSSHNSGILLQLQNTSIHIKYVVRSFKSIQRKKIL